MTKEIKKIEELTLANTDIINELASDDLKLATERINVYIGNIKENTFAIASELSRINKYEIFKEDFKSMAEYGEAIFGFKKTFTYNLIKLGDKFIDENGKLKLDGNYSPGQLTELVSLPFARVKSMEEANMLNDGMTQKEIREKVKEFKDNKNNKKNTESSLAYKPPITEMKISLNVNADGDSHNIQIELFDEKYMAEKELKGKEYFSYIAHRTEGQKSALLAVKEYIDNYFDKLYQEYLDHEDNTEQIEMEDE